MSATKTFLTAVCLALTGVTPALGQYPSSPYSMVETDGAAPQARNITTDGQKHSLSHWIRYDQECGCFGPLGGDGPIGQEWYVRSGYVVPVGGEVLSNMLNPGWTIGVGARTAFFTPDMFRANIFDLSISNFNNGSDPVEAAKVPLTILFNNGVTRTVTVKDFNRTFLNVAFGRECYLFAPADSPEGNLSVGFDAGGRYGSSRMRFREQGARHTTDVIGGAFTAVYVNYLCPFDDYNGCILEVGARAEYSYTWSDIMKTVSDMQDVNFTLNVGVRY